MGDTLSWAADKERDRWESSTEYTLLKEKCDLYNSRMKELSTIECGSLTIAEIRLLLRMPHSISVDCRDRIPSDSDIEQLKAILSEHA